jgi:DNA-binding MarR family transcriptional regulator
MSTETTGSKRLTFLVKAAELTQRVSTAPILSTYKLSYAQLAMLLSIGSTPGKSGAQLARMHGITAQSAGEVIGTLVRRGLLNRRPGPGNARVQLIDLTTTGEHFFAEIQLQLNLIDARLTSGLPETDLAVARRVLATIIANGDNIDLEHIDTHQE